MTPVIFSMITKTNHEMIESAIPATARVIVCLPAVIPLESPELVKILKPPTSTMMKERKPMRGMMAPKIFSKYPGRQESSAAESKLLHAIISMYYRTKKSPCGDFLYIFVTLSLVGFGWGDVATKDINTKEVLNDQHDCPSRGDDG